MLSYAYDLPIAKATSLDRRLADLRRDDGPERTAVHCRAAAEYRQREHRARAAWVRRESAARMWSGTAQLSNPSETAWFNTKAFAIAPPGQFGNAGRNILDGPGLTTVNLSIVKNTKLAERLNMQFRAEFFNLFNTTNFNLPDSFLGSATFGQILSAKDPRRMQFGLKFLF